MDGQFTVHRGAATKDHCSCVKAIGHCATQPRIRLITMSHSSTKVSVDDTSRWLCQVALIPVMPNKYGNSVGKADAISQKRNAVQQWLPQCAQGDPPICMDVSVPEDGESVETAETDRLECSLTLSAMLESRLGGKLFDDATTGNTLCGRCCRNIS